MSESDSLPEDTHPRREVPEREPIPIALGRKLRDPLMALQSCLEVLRLSPAEVEAERIWELLDRQLDELATLVGSLDDAREHGDRGASASVSMSAETPRTAGRATLRVLVIEDDRDVAESLRLLLEVMGHRVETAYDGITGVARALGFRPDLAFCDIGLPGLMDGYAVARAFRTDDRLRGVRLVALTGLGSSEDRARTREAGFEMHLTKPVPWTALREALSISNARIETAS